MASLAVVRVPSRSRSIFASSAHFQSSDPFSLSSNVEEKGNQLHAYCFHDQQAHGSGSRGPEEVGCDLSRMMRRKRDMMSSGKKQKKADIERKRMWLKSKRIKSSDWPQSCGCGCILQPHRRGSDKWPAHQRRKSSRSGTRKQLEKKERQSVCKSSRRPSKRLVLLPRQEELKDDER